MTPETEKLIKQVHAKGFNISMMFNAFKKRKHLIGDIPDEVKAEVCQEYLKRADEIKQDYPYFTRVAYEILRRHNAAKNEHEAKKLKGEPTAINNIFAQMAKQGVI